MSTTDSTTQVRPAKPNPNPEYTKISAATDRAVAECKSYTFLLLVHGIFYH